MTFQFFEYITAGLIFFSAILYSSVGHGGASSYIAIMSLMGTPIDSIKPIGLVLSIALIFAGALGNIIDSVVYGVVFDHSHHQIASFLPESGGYAKVFYGNVVDMLYFPLFSGHFPDWMWKVGGDYFLFFRPVFNVADTAISAGVISIAVFQKRFFGK